MIVQLRFSWDLLLWLNKVKEDKLPFIWWQQYYCTSWPDAVQWQHLRVWCYSGQRHTRCFLYSSECSLIPGAVQRPATSWIDSIMWQYRTFPWAELSPHILEQIKANNNQIWKTSVQILFVFNLYKTGPILGLDINYYSFTKAAFIGVLCHAAAFCFPPLFLERQCISIHFIFIQCIDWMISWIVIKIKYIKSNQIKRHVSFLINFDEVTLAPWIDCSFDFVPYKLTWFWLFFQFVILTEIIVTE